MASVLIGTDNAVSVVVHRWDGSAWSAVGPPAPISNTVREIVVDAQGAPWIAVAVGYPDGLEILRLSGNTWKIVGAPRPPVGHRSLATTSDGAVWRAWVEADGGVSVGQFGPG